MEPKVKILPPEVLMAQLPGLLEEAESVPLVISGNSMCPFLVHGRDTVYLSKVTDLPQMGDMILYRRDSGAYILHRVVRVRGDRFDLTGDAQVLVERGIRQDQILARVTAVRRKGKLLKKGSFLWDFFEHIWPRMIPLRRPLIDAYSRLLGKGA